MLYQYQIYTEEFTLWLMRSRSKQGEELDLKELAASVTEEVINENPSEATELEDEGKNPAAVALGRLGGLNGEARAAELAKKQRSESARNAAKARWEKAKRPKV